jgi:hypothetical protein
VEVSRRSIPIIPAVSLILCILTAAFWVPSYWRHLTLNRLHGDRLFGVSIRSGDLVLVWDSNPYRDNPTSRWKLECKPPDRFHTEGHSRGIIRTFDKRLGVASTLVYIPLWLPFVGLALLPVNSATVLLISNWRRARKRCPKCSYNLTGNQSGICPECGTALS